MGNFQMAMLVTGFLLGTAIMYIPILGNTEQNMWFSALIGWAIGMVYIYLISKIKQPKNYPLLLSAILSLYSLYMAAMVTRNVGEIMNITILTMTPHVVINATMVALAAYGVIMGIEVVSRLAVPFIFTAWFFGVLLILISAQEMNISNLMPILDHDYKIIIKDSINYAAFPFMETVVFLPLLKLAKNPPKALTAGALLAGTMLLHSFIIILLVLPPGIINKTISPTFLTISALPSGEFIRALVVIIWMQTGFLKIAIFLYVCCTQLSEIFKINYRSTVLPISVIVVSLSTLLFNNIIEMFNAMFDTYPYFAIPIQLCIPLLYLLANRKLKMKNNG